MKRAARSTASEKLKSRVGLAVVLKLCGDQKNFRTLEFRSAISRNLSRRWLQSKRPPLWRALDLAIFQPPKATAIASAYDDVLPASWPPRFLSMFFKVTPELPRT